MAGFDYDLAILGGGSAGLTAAKTARFFAKKVALVDKERLGGDCLHYGCVPSKALIKASRVMHEVKNASRYGLELNGTEVTLGAVNGRVHAAIDEIARLDSEENLRALGVDVLLGGARFVDAHTIAIGDRRRITAKHVLIATGSRPARPRISGLDQFWTNEDVFDLRDLPKRLAVLGGGPIGVELAQAFARLGTKVTIIQRGEKLIPRDDPDAIAVLEKSFATEGIDVAFATEVTKVRAEGGERVLSFKGRRTDDLRADAILVAVGRSPNVEGLGLEHAGVRFTPRGISVNERLQTNQSHIYAAGDVVGGLLFTHFAGYQAAHAVRNIFLPIKMKFEPGYVPWVTFTDPEIAHVGLTEPEAKKTGREHHIVRFPYSHHERAITDQEPVGLMKFLIDQRRRIAGCHIAGAGAGEIINEITLAMNNDLSVDRVIMSIHAYPTYSFGIPIALYDFVLNEEPAAIAKVGRFLSKLT
jgi:pyruvate/2-oxoglutarate dehydrogenase complex dihydrolipoamide dehydrogenase (E3) component